MDEPLSGGTTTIRCYRDRRTERARRHGSYHGLVIGGGILYLVLIVTLGVTTIRKGHTPMFIFGIFFPFLWLIGAIMPPAVRR